VSRRTDDTTAMCQEHLVIERGSGSLRVRMRHAPRRASLLLAVAALSWLLIGCGGNTSSASTEPTATTSATAGCADAAALKSSLDALKNVDVKNDGVDALTTALTDVKTKLDAAAASASSVLKPQIQQVQTAVDSLQTATNGLSTSNVTQKAPAIADALAQVATATSALTTTLSQDCPTS
jgi:hypothetical protein